MVIFGYVGFWQLHGRLARSLPDHRPWPGRHCRATMSPRATIGACAQLEQEFAEIVTTS